MLGNGNYLLYAAAAHWINSLTLICHPKWTHDYYPIIMKDKEDNSGIIQLKRFSEKIDIKDSNQDFEIDREIKFSIVEDYSTYYEPYSCNFDYVIVSQSPSYSPSSADFILDLVKDYISIV